MSTYFENDQRISIGEVAEMFNISQRTLRLYHDMELLVPQFVDDGNGYRYYSRNQFQRLETIIQMKSVGLSLKQIKAMLDSQNLSLYEALLSARIDALSEQIIADSAMRDTLIKQLNSCAHLRNPPVLDTPFIEFIPRRTAFFFDIDAYDLHLGDGTMWAHAVDKIRSILSKENLPPSLLNQICCVVSQEDLFHWKLWCSGALVFTDRPLTTNLPHKTIPGGTYACLFRNYIAMDNQAEYAGLVKLLHFIEGNNYQIAGPYLGEVVAKTSIFDYCNNSILVKMQIPIKLSE